VKASEISATKVRDEIVAGGEVEKQKLVATGKALIAEQKNRMEKDVYSQAISIVEVALGKVLSKKEFKAEDQAIITQAVAEISVK
jgi:F0F1-type ATP synthase membrane subunit b/b'